MIRQTLRRASGIHPQTDQRRDLERVEKDLSGQARNRDLSIVFHQPVEIEREILLRRIGDRPERDARDPARVADLHDDPGFHFHCLITGLLKEIRFFFRSADGFFRAKKNRTTPFHRRKRSKQDRIFFGRRIRVPDRAADLQSGIERSGKTAGENKVRGEIVKSFF